MPIPALKVIPEKQPTGEYQGLRYICDLQKMTDCNLSGHNLQW